MLKRLGIPYRYAVALAAALGLFMAVMDSTVVNVALSTMLQDFHTDINTIQWVITAYTLVQAALIPTAGYLSNRFGIKRLFMLALALFTIGSLLAGLSPHIAGSNGGERWLIIFRVIQGAAAGMLSPLTTAIAFGAFKPEQRATASAVIAIPVMIAPAFGPTIGGLIVDSSFGWPGIFYINIPVGIISLFLIWRIMRPERSRAQAASAPRFDVPGLLLSMVGVTLLVYAFVLVSQAQPGSVTKENPNGVVYGWHYWPVWALAAAGAAMLAVFTWYELRVAKDPVLDLHLFRDYDFAIAAIVMWIVRAVIFGSFILIPLFLQEFQGRSAVETGLIMMGQGIGSIIGVQTGTRMYDRIGPRIVVLFGLSSMTIATFLLIGVRMDSGPWFFVPILFVRGIGFGWTNLPLQTVALSAITGAALPKASSLYRATGQVFSSTGVAVVSTFLVQHTAQHATRIATAAHAAGKPVPANIALQAGTKGTSDVFLILTISTLAAIIASFFLPNKSLKQRMANQPAGASGQPAPEHHTAPAHMDD